MWNLLRFYVPNHYCHALSSQCTLFSPKKRAKLVLWGVFFTMDEKVEKLSNMYERCGGSEKEPNSEQFG